MYLHRAVVLAFILFLRLTVATARSTLFTDALDIASPNLTRDLHDHLHARAISRDGVFARGLKKENFPRSLPPAKAQSKIETLAADTELMQQAKLPRKMQIILGVTDFSYPVLQQHAKEIASYLDNGKKEQERDIEQLIESGRAKDAARYEQAAIAWREIFITQFVRRVMDVDGRERKAGQGRKSDDGKDAFGGGGKGGAGKGGAGKGGAFKKGFLG